MNRIMNIVVLVFVLSFIGQSVFAIAISDPYEMSLQALVSNGSGGGAAWLEWNGYEFLVNEKFMIGTDLRVTEVNYNSVVLYRASVDKEFVIRSLAENPRRARGPVLWTFEPMPMWKITRMVALAYRQDYISHHTVGAIRHARAYEHNMRSLLRNVVDPYHRYGHEDEVIFVAPSHIYGIGWNHLLRRIKRYNSSVLGEWFPILNEKSSLISDGRPLDELLYRIAHQTGVSIKWKHPVMIPVFCSLRDRSWHDILKLIVIFNGLEILPTHEGLEVR